MQYRGFIHFVVLLLASGCFVFGLQATLMALLAFSLSLELLIHCHVFQCGNIDEHPI